MKRLALVLLLAGPALGQIAVTSAPCKMTDGSCAAASPLTTKGDVFGFSTVAARIPIGTNGQVLTADSTQALGLKWAAISASGDVEAVNITTTAPVTGGANCASGTCAFTLGITGGTVSGLTLNKVPKASSATALADSSITDDGTTLTLGNAGVTVTEATGAFGLTQQAVGTVPLAITGAANQTASLLTITGGATPGAAFSPFLSVTGTLPASPASQFNAAEMTFAGAGAATAGINRFGFRTAMTAGTSSGMFATAVTSAIYATNASLGGGDAPDIGRGNFAGIFEVSSSHTSTGSSGVYATSANSGWGRGVIGKASATTDAAGVMGIAGAAGTYRVGGKFLLSATNADAYNYVTAALVADNQAVAAPIFLARDNGTTVFSVEDGGYLTGATGGVAGTLKWGVPSATPQAYTHTLSASSRGGTDTNVAGANATILPGLGTGTAAPATLTLSTANPTTTGSTQQTALPSIVLKNGNLAMADNTAVAVFTVDLPTADTGCGVVTMINYTATDGTDTVSHQTMWSWAFTNDDGTVTGSASDAAEAVNGTGCAIGCDSASVTVVGTVASAKLNFDNTLSVTGNLRANVLYNSCGSLTLQ